MSENEVVQKWIERAREDLQLVENELKIEDPLFNIIAFHIQQFVEKYLKVFLISKNIMPERTHSIDLLLYKCKDVDNDFEEYFESSLVDLTDCAVSIRYPDSDIVVDEDFVNEVLDLAYKLKKLIDTKLGIEFPVQQPDESEDTTDEEN